MTGLPRAVDARDDTGVPTASRHGVQRSRAAGCEQDGPRRSPGTAPRLKRAGERPHELRCRGRSASTDRLRRIRLTGRPGPRTAPRPRPPSRPAPEPSPSRANESIARRGPLSSPGRRAFGGQVKSQSPRGWRRAAWQSADASPARRTPRDTPRIPGPSTQTAALTMAMVNAAIHPARSRHGLGVAATTPACDVVSDAIHASSSCRS